MFKVGDVVALKDDPFQVQWKVTRIERAGTSSVLDIKSTDNVTHWVTSNEAELWTVED